MRKLLMTTVVTAAMTVGSTLAWSGQVAIDLSHPLPTFAPMADDPGKPDLSKPLSDLPPIPTFGQQTVLSFVQFPTNQGHFDIGTVVLSEHHGTHLDTSAHYVNNAETQQAGNPVAADRKFLHQLGGIDLTGPIVLIDVSARVQAELDKNGGAPSPDPSVTNFSNDSGNNVTADDIAAIEDQIDNGVWLVLHQGWGRFYFDGVDFGKDPYVNGFNYPGLTPAAVDKIIEIEDRKGVRINGIMSDVVGVETGENSLGTGGNFTDSWYAHVVGLQRGWKLVENGANLEQLAQAGGDCTLVVGAPKWAMGTGGPSRVIALCGN